MPYAGGVCTSQLLRVVLDSVAKERGEDVDAREWCILSWCCVALHFKYSLVSNRRMITAHRADRSAFLPLKFSLAQSNLEKLEDFLPVKIPYALRCSRLLKSARVWLNYAMTCLILSLGCVIHINRFCDEIDNDDQILLFPSVICANFNFKVVETSIPRA